MSQQSEIDICNLALQWLGAKRILSLTDVPPPESEESATTRELCALNYPIARDATLEDGDWTFATRVFNLNKLADDPAPINDPRPPYEGSLFQLPGDVLRVIQADDGEGNYRRDWYRLEDRIVMDAEKCYAVCIIRVTDTLRFTSNFVQACAARLGAEIAVPITESNRREEQMWAKYLEKLDWARANDGMQGAEPGFRSDRLRVVRSSGTIRFRG